MFASDSLAPIAPDHSQPLGNKLITDIPPVHRDPAKPSPVFVRTSAMEFGRLAQDYAEAVSGGISGARVAAVAARATGKLGSIDRAGEGDEADAGPVTEAQAISVMDRS
ncbi:hypothetical protein ATM17_12600 [Sphingopyxis macrogoltabida]|uniref:Uncharacterized protein n=1 Tax=Sphingopyxis macrogoltabida TaxID=33050 RepID=A0AAC8Z121_SPHMC|nr:hypothetical protein LH19_07230 [Sphingopyxis macrogoltabida]AMU89875.1 hypothetical protein ATM17_12600 [Sphingopyxis macrogoltabida]